MGNDVQRELTRASVCYRHSRKRIRRAKQPPDGYGVRWGVGRSVEHIRGGMHKGKFMLAA